MNWCGMIGLINVSAVDKVEVLDENSIMFNYARDVVNVKRVIVNDMVQFEVWSDGRMFFREPKSRRNEAIYTKLRAMAENELPVNVFKIGHWR